MKRFYKEVVVDAAGDGHRILLDGRAVHSPARRPLAMPSAALAEEVAQEWRAQGETIDRAGMGLTRLVSTALDRMPGLRGAAIDEVIGYAATDLLCYRAAGPVELAERQRRSWQPWLDWLAKTHGAKLVVTTAMLPVSQPEPGGRAAAGGGRGSWTTGGWWACMAPPRRSAPSSSALPCSMARSRRRRRWRRACWTSCSRSSAGAASARPSGASRRCSTTSWPRRPSSPACASPLREPVLAQVAMDDLSRETVA